MSQGVGSKERKRTIQASLDLPEKSAGTIEIAIPDQGGASRNPDGFPPLPYGMLGFIKSVRGDEWSR